MTAVVFIHRAGIISPIAPGACSHDRAGRAPLRPTGYVLRTGRGVTGPREGQPTLGVSSPDCRSSFVGSGLFGGLPAQARCRASRRRIVEQIHLQRGRLAGRALAHLRPVAQPARAVATASMSCEFDPLREVGIALNRLPNQAACLQLPPVVHPAAPRVEAHSTRENRACASRKTGYPIQPRSVAI